MQDQRIGKRINIVIIFLVLFSIISFTLFYFFSSSATCFDGIKNQSEKEVDCGGTCAPCRDAALTKDIIIEKVATTLGGNGSYDVVARIVNPNDVIGASSFHYVFTLKDSTGNIIATREGNTFILPADSRYVAELGISVTNSSVPASIDFVISDVSWEKLNEIGKPQIGVFGKNFGANPAGEGSEADAIVRNQSTYSLKKIFVVVILRSENGDIVGVNKTEIDTIRAKEERDFRLTWPYQLSAPVQSMEVDTQSNAFDSQNFSFN